MANRRMFAKTITNSARFLRMPPTSRLLYYDLGMQADDDGIVEAFTVMRTTGAAEDDLRVLVSKGFVTLLNDDYVAYINDWNENNYIRNDRYQKSVYAELLIKINDEPDTVYQMDTNGIPYGYQMETQVRLGKDSIDKDNKKNTCPEPETPSPDRSGILLPLVDGSDYDVPLSKIQKWVAAYPAADVNQELQKMIAWLTSNPKKRKTKRGIDRFINNWLSRTQDQGGTYRAAGQQNKPKQSNRFNNFDQRSYDYGDLERQLMASQRGGSDK